MFNNLFLFLRNMKKESYNVIGVMSGTSLDGVDLVYCELVKQVGWQYKIIHAETYSYSDEWREQLKNAVLWNHKELALANEDYTRYLASVINRFKSEFNLTEIDMVSSHGHTVFHQPENGITIQIGNLPVLAELIHETVVCDFRVQDVQLGGQGAPLVPIGDKLLFHAYDYCLNLGGFANISFDDVTGERIAYDVCPVNVVLNHYCNQLGLEFDEGGNVARTGIVNTGLLNKLNGLPFYSLPYPKSLGMEWVRRYVFPLIDTFEISVSDILRTWVEHCAYQIGGLLINKGNVLITGGGAFNSFLIERIENLAGITVKEADKNLIMFKEALIFAFLGVLRYRGDINCLKSVTGAKKNHSSGFIFKP